MEEEKILHGILLKKAKEAQYTNFEIEQLNLQSESLFIRYFLEREAARIVENTNIEEDVLKKIYEENQTLYKFPKKVKIDTIFVKDLAKAEEILKEVNLENFNELKDKNDEKGQEAKGVTDEFVVPVKIGSKDNGLIKDGDGVIFANFRPDRARQLTRMFVDPEFKGFDRKVYPKVNFVTMAQYDASFDSPIAFPPEKIVNCFGEVVSKAGLIQVRTAETEKYAHVTFFFNGGKEEPYPGEIRLLSDSPKVATYDLQPEMSAYKVKDRLIEELNTGKVDTVILNFANPDMVGHTGNVGAVIAACQAVDNCTGQIVNKVLELDGAVLITADHGNADLLVNPETGEPHTAHTVNPVPFIFITNDMKDAKLRTDGKLADITPTMLDLLGLEKPAEMDGSTLIVK